MSGHVASLHPYVTKLITPYAEKHVNLFAKLEHKKIQVDRMSKDNDFIPRSARVNFEFYVRPQISEMDDFTVIKDETTRMIDDFQQNIKSQIVRVAIMEINCLHQELNDNLVQLIHHTTKAFHLQYNPDAKNHTVTTTIAHLINAHGETILKHSNLDNNGFEQTYSLLFNDTSINNFNSTGRVSFPNNPNNPYSQNATISQQTNTILPSHLGEAINFIDNLRNTLEVIICTSIDNYVNQVNTNKVTSKLEAYGSEILLEKATADTTEMMDLSKSVAPEELQELVTKSTNAAVSSLKKEIQSLKDKLRDSNGKQKNSSSRGTASASLKNKTKGKSSKPKSKSNESSKSTSPTEKRKESKTSNQNRGRRTNDSRNDSKNKKDGSKRKNGQRRRQRSRSRESRR